MKQYWVAVKHYNRQSKQAALILQQAGPLDQKAGLLVTKVGPLKISGSAEN